MALWTVTAGDLPALALLARCLGSGSEAAAVLERADRSPARARRPRPTRRSARRAPRAHRLLADFGMPPRGQNYVAPAQAASADDPLAEFLQPA